MSLAIRSLATMSLTTIVPRDKFYDRLIHKKPRIIIQIRDLRCLLGLILTKIQTWKKARTSWCLFVGISADFRRFQLIYGLFKLISGVFTCFFVCLFFPRKKVVNANSCFFSMSDKESILQSWHNFGICL